MSDVFGDCSVLFFEALCEALSHPTNGSLITSTNGTTTSVEYSCDVGFTMSGDRTSKCSSDGTWTMTSPTCCKWLNN